VFIFVSTSTNKYNDELNKSDSQSGEGLEGVDRKDSSGLSTNKNLFSDFSKFRPASPVGKISPKKLSISDFFHPPSPPKVISTSKDGGLLGGSYSKEFSPVHSPELLSQSTSSELSSSYLSSFLSSSTRVPSGYLKTKKKLKQITASETVFLTSPQSKNKPSLTSLLDDYAKGEENTLIRSDDNNELEKEERIDDELNKGINNEFDSCSESESLLFPLCDGESLESTSSLPSLVFLSYLTADSFSLPTVATQGVTESNFCKAIGELVFGRDNVETKEPPDVKDDSDTLGHQDISSSTRISENEEGDTSTLSLTSTFSLLQSQLTQMIVVGQFNLAFIVALLDVGRFLLLLWFLLFLFF
jgi:hypothetical protein